MWSKLWHMEWISQQILLFFIRIEELNWAIGHMKQKMQTQQEAWSMQRLVDRVWYVPGDDRKLTDKVWTKP
jgi:hypothetical protein